MRLQPAALFARRHIWLVYFVDLVCLVGLVCLIGLVYLLVCLLVGLLVCLVGLVSMVWGLLVSSVYRSGLKVGLSGWSGLSITMSIGMVVWVTIIVTHGDLSLIHI